MPEQKSLSEAMKGVFDRLFATFAEHRWESILRSYTLASRDERRCRLSAIMDLSALLAAIKKQHMYATAIYGDSLIEAIIEGNWKEARRVANDILFYDMTDPERLMFTELWAPFRARALAACDAADLIARVEYAEVEAAKKPTSASGS
jgi:hypothetical protein